jgi:quercetin dioxygenase-like cupin family protein
MAEPAMELAISMQSEPHFVKGRRDFLKYRDLGVTAASRGHMRAQVTSATKSMSRPTGWHYHVCQEQFVYMLSGWIDLQFADGRIVRFAGGDSVFIPGGTVHNEIRTSDKFDLIEVSVPADMGTVPCDAPEAFAEDA